MKHYPLLFTFQEIVFCKGFVAAVAAHGRVLAFEEEDGWWFSGVEPGDIAAGGSDFAEAGADFRRAFTTVLYDIAGSAEDHNTFKAEVGAFFDAADDEEAGRWVAALNDIRAHGVDDGALPKGLPTVRVDDAPHGVDVTIFEVPDAVTPTANVLQVPPMAMAA